MPLSPKSTGFSDDGLSYSVAGDYNKLLGQALADYEARSTNPQSFQESDQQYQQRVGSASGILGNELAPLGIGNALSSTLLRQQRGNQVRNVHLAPGSSTGHVDPSTGMFVLDYTAPAHDNSGQKRIDNEEKSIALEKAAIYKQLGGMTGTDQETFDQKNQLQNRLLSLERNRHDLYKSSPQAAAIAAAIPPAAAAQPPAQQLNPSMFMGTPGGTNLIQQSLAQPAPAAAIVKPGQRGVKILGIRPSK